MSPNPQFSEYLVTFTEEILHIKPQFLYSVAFKKLFEACFWEKNKVLNDNMLYHQL